MNMAFGDSILSRFTPMPLGQMDPAYEGLGDIEDDDDVAFDFIDNIVYGGAFESVMADEDDEELLAEGEDIDGYIDDDIDIDEDEELLEEGCLSANEGFGNMTPKQRHDNFVKMIMGNKKLTSQQKRERIAKYEASHPANEALSSLVNNDIFEGETSDLMAEILGESFDHTEYPDPELNARAKHAAGLRTDLTQKSDIDKLIHDLIFDGDSKAGYAANLKTSYAKESVDDDFFM